MYDPSVLELNIEEIMMQEASSGSGLDALDPSSQDALGRIQNEASNIADKARNTREEISKRVEEFEPLISTIAKGEEREITQEHLQALDRRVSELQGIAHGQNIIEEAEQSGVDENIAHSASAPKSTEHTRDTSESSVSDRSRGLSIENMIMEEAMSGHNDQLLSDSQKYLYGEVQGVADAVKQGIDETKDEVSHRMSGFEPLLDISKSEEREITEEHLEAINEKLSELHDVSFGHDLKIFREIENPKPVEEVVKDIIQQTSVKEPVTKTMLESEDKAVIKSVPKENSEVQTEGAFKSVPKENSEVQTESAHKSATSSANAAAELENSISQVAKPVTLDDSYTSTATEVKVEVHVDPTVEVSQVERDTSIGTTSEGTSSSSAYTPQNSSPLTPDGTGGAAAAAMSSMAATAAVGAGASFATAAARVAVAATGISTPSVSIDSPIIRPEASAAPSKPKPKLLGKKPLAKEKPKSTVCIVLYFSRGKFLEIHFQYDS